ncbi:MAG: signal peptide peptidase SppA [Candidatus Loosdrechtia sp.]|uniref:S49 family peptidase n=1 Tax=Candidatus Loosdrechtia sp. TaxID=3101272 RepID=UPI003A6199D5|nr:MAG: signal peptide peptidase SppA [Candidatus Jettenia sp. AMX2]
MKNAMRIRTIPACIMCVFFLIFFPGCTLISISLIPPLGPLEETTVAGTGRDKILVIDISGIISSGRGKDGFASLSEKPDIVSRVREELQKAARDKSVKAIVLRINSPGGEVTASDTIYHEIEKFKKVTGMKVVACIMDLGTSGSYYVAVAADKIIAHPTAVTGSIGVVMLHISVEGLLQKIGVEDTTIKTAEHKNMGSPLKTMTEEERKIFQDVLNSMHERFLAVILKNRKELTIEKVVPIADGRIYTAQQALEHRLIDTIGYLDDAILMAKKEAGLTDVRVIMYHRPGVYKNNIYSRLENPVHTNFINIDLKTFVRPGTPSFMYLWAP